MERRGHILVMAYPAQGHVIPMMELSQSLVKHGFKITFVNTEYNHKRVLKALIQKDFIEDHINLVSIPDGLEPWEDRNDLSKFVESFFSFVPGKLEELIRKMNASEDEKITCFIVDEALGWTLEVAERMKIPGVIFCSGSAAMHSLLFNMDKLIQEGIIDINGTLLKNQMIELGPGMPALSTSIFDWKLDATAQKHMIDIILKRNEAVKLADWIISNSAYALEPGAFTLSPKILPIGPLLASTRQGNSTGSFWQEDTNCLKWLDQQPQNSVIYIAFGSLAIFDKTQFQELALGLELTGRPFLWVVRSGITKETNVYPQGFEERVGNQGKIVEWAPQQKVLSHPSVGCFLSHCGWNSTLEGVANGVPFLCWPYFADQPVNASYICDLWKVGLDFERDEFGTINRDEIKKKVEEVLSDEKIKVRAKEVKGMALKSVGENGHSNKILSDFVEWLNGDLIIRG
ncbi:UDP-glycosyltransferase 83A1-like [Euphorbia lathyris]|uniref:UDP-glycosyltransferase 83A1-like n=1 Tax=Euphorbia lathyris TaxID=212925 RepID=UPI0033141F8D